MAPDSINPQREAATRGTTDATCALVVIGLSLLPPLPKHAEGRAGFNGHELPAPPSPPRWRAAERAAQRPGGPAEPRSVPAFSFSAHPRQSNFEDSFAGGVEMKLVADLIKHSSHFGA